jgi:hypothetical protein
MRGDFMVGNPAFLKVEKNVEHPPLWAVLLQARASAPHFGLLG